MNKVFRIIWNSTLGRQVVASEAARSRGTSSAERLQPASPVAVGGSSAGALRPLTVAIGLAVAGAAIPVAIAQDATYDNLTVNGDAILSALQVSGNASIGGTLTVGGVNVATATDILGLESDITALGDRVDATEGNITALDDRVDAAEGNITALDDRVDATEGNITALDDRVDATEGNITALDDRVDATEGNITALDDRVDATEGNINDLDGRVTDNEVNIESIEESLSDLGVDADNPGVKYFRANSEQDDSQANGQESIAIGPNTVSEGASSLAAGDGATTTATAEGAIALGQRAAAGGALTGGAGAIAVGRDSLAGSDSAVALGDGAQSTGGNATALGVGAQASGTSAIAVGDGAVAAAADNISIGQEAGVGTVDDIASDQTNNIAVGAQAGQRVVGQRNLAMGSSAGSDTDGNDNIALGENAGTGLTGDSNISIGRNAGDPGGTINRAISIGEDASAGSDGIAMGHAASAAGLNGVALGVDARTQGDGVGVGAGSDASAGFVALGARSEASAVRDVTGPSAVTNRAFDGTAVSVGSSAPGGEFTRRIVNVEDGANETDAVNVRQLLTAIEEAEEFGGVIDYDELGSRVDGNFAEQIEENRTKYVSINDGGNQAGNFDNTGASGGRSIAIGPDATTTGTDSTAMGSDVLTSGNSSVGIGHDIRAVGDNTTVIGNDRTEARDTSGVAIGTNAVSRGDRSIVIGTDSEADDQDGTDVQNSIVIGTESQSTAREGIVIGRDSLVNAERGMAQGDNAQTTAVDAMAFGTQSSASGVNSQASGTRASASGTNAIATGTDATGYANDGIAMGNGAESGFVVTSPGDAPRNHGSIAIGDSSLANDLDALALGVEARATDESATAIGDNAEATADNALAVGSDADASATNASAFGQDATASADAALASGAGASAAGGNSVALGSGAKAQNQDSTAVGSGAQAQANNASALGQGARATHANSVALGAGSVTAEVNPTSEGTVGGITYGGFAGTDPLSVVSVGSAGNERQVTNVAAGRISDTSTDAINGSQLFATNTVIGNVANSLADGPESVLGGNASVGGDGTISMTDIGGTGEDTVHDAIEYAAQGWDVSAQDGAEENVAPGGSVDFSNTDGNINIARNGTDLTFDLADDIQIGNSVTIGDTVIDGDSVTTNNLIVEGETRLGDQFVVNNDNTVTYNGQEIANQNDGLSFAGNTGGTIDKRLGDDTPLILSGQLAAGEASSGANLRVDSDGDRLNLVMARNLTELDSVTTGDTVMNGDGVSVGDDVQLGDTGLEIADGPSVTTGGIDAGGERITHLAPGVDGSDAVNVDQLGDVAAIANAGWNVSAEDGESANVAPDGEVNFSSSDGNIDITRPAGSTDLEFALADTIHVGSVGLDGRDGQDGLTIVGGDGAPGLNGEDGITRIIYTDDDGNEREVATLDDGLNFAGNTGDDIAKKLGETLAITGELGDAADASGTNLRVDSVDGELQLVMARDLTDLNSITITDGPVISGDGIDMADNQITNLAAGTGDDHAVNLGQLNDVEATANAGWNLTGSGENEVNIGPDGAVDFQGDSNISVAQSGADDDGQIEVALNENIDLGETGSVTTGDTVMNDGGVTVDDGTGNFTKVGAGSISVAGGGNTIAIGGESGDITGLTNTDLDGTDFAQAGRAATEEQLNLVNQTANAGWNLTGSGENEVNIGPDGAVDFQGDSNISVAQSGADDDGQIDITLTRDLDVDSVTAGDSRLDTNGLVVNDSGDIPTATTTVEAGTITVAANPTTGPANEIVIDANSGTIGGLTNTTFDPDNFVSGQAATEDQLGQVYTVANAGWNVSVDGEGALADGSNNVGPDDVVDFSSDDGNIVIEREGTDLAFGLADSITLGEGEHAVTVNGEEGSVSVGDTLVDGDGVRIGEDVALGDAGLEIADGPSVTTGGIDAGGMVITNVAPGEISETSSDAVNGSQLYRVEQVAGAGWNLTGSGQNSVNIGPDGAVDFQGDSNITVSQTGVDQDGVIEVALNDTITLGEGDTAVSVDGDNGLVSVGDTVMDGDGVRIGDDVSLDDSGLTIAGGPSVTIGGINAGGMVITNVASGMGGQQLDQISGDDLMNAVNVGDLQQVAGDIGQDVAAAKTEVEAGKNITVNQSTGDDGQTIYEVATADDVEFDSIEVGSVNIDKDNVDENGNTIITGVGRGEISADSTDAVNGSQLHDVQQELGDINGALDGGMNFAADEGDDVNRTLGDTVAITGDDNITTQTSENGVQVTLNNELNVDSVTTGKTTVSDAGVTIEGGPSMTVDGIDGGGKRITNVAPGVDATDAVNVGQMQELNQRFANEINNVYGRINDVEKSANAGTASALAAATVPQAWMPGKNMVGVGAGTYEGESAVSVGVSRLSDNGRWVIQGKVTGDSQSNFGAGIGAGWHW